MMDDRIAVFTVITFRELFYEAIGENCCHFSRMNCDIYLPKCTDFVEVII